MTTNSTEPKTERNASLEILKAATVEIREAYINLETLLPWGDAKPVNTGKGPRLLRKAPAPPESPFWTLWNSNKSDLKAAGISCGKDRDTGEWCALWWIPVNTAEVVEDKKEAIAASNAQDSDYEVPTPEGLAFLPYQRAGVEFCVRNIEKTGVLLGDTMGLGKGVQAVGVINSIPEIKSVLCVVPASLKVNWHRELSKWLTRKMSVGIAEGKFFPPTDIVIINFQIMAKNEAACRAKTWDLVVIDEAHNLKNPKSQMSAYSLGRKEQKKKDKATGEIKVIPAISPIPTKRKLCLTGTALVNRTMEMFPILNFLDPQTWSNGFKFGLRYANGYQKYVPRKGGGEQAVWDFSGSSHLDELNERLRTSGLMIRRLKDDVLKDLPAKQRQIIELPSAGLGIKDMGLEMDAKIDKLEAQVVISAASENPAEYDEAVKKLAEARDFAFTEMAKIRHEHAVAALPLCLEHIQEAMEETNKIIIFAHHLDVITELKKEFPNHACIVGGMSGEAKMAEVDRFQNDPKCGPFIGGMEATKEGLTLTAASHVIFVEQNWVPGVLSQCEDRAHRIGQKSTVLVQHLVLEGSIGAKMIKRCINKQNIIDAVLDKEIKLEAEDAPTTIQLTDNKPVTPKSVAEAAVKLTPEQIKAIHTGLKMLAGVCDGAQSLDGKGFAGPDVHIGHSFANSSWLSPKMAVIGQRILRKYSRQLPEEILEQAGAKK